MRRLRSISKSVWTGRLFAYSAEVSVQEILFTCWSRHPTPYGCFEIRTGRTPRRSREPISKLRMSWRRRGAFLLPIFVLLRCRKSFPDMSWVLRSSLKPDTATLACMTPPVFLTQPLYDMPPYHEAVIPLGAPPVSVPLFALNSRTYPSMLLTQSSTLAP